MPDGTNAEFEVILLVVVLGTPTAVLQLYLVVAGKTDALGFKWLVDVSRAREIKLFCGGWLAGGG